MPGEPPLTTRDLPLPERRPPGPVLANWSCGAGRASEIPQLTPRADEEPGVEAVDNAFQGF